MYETKIPRVETHEHAAYVATQVNTGFKPGQRYIRTNIAHWQCYTNGICLECYFSDFMKLCVAIRLKHRSTVHNQRVWPGFF